ncbi:MAG: DUF222 domain-containing protein [Ilumatobacteraceae bacterium]
MHPTLDLELDEIAGYLNAQHARLARLARRLLDDPGDWTGPGLWRLEQFLCWRTGIGLPCARQIVTVAERLPELPYCGAAFDRGELSLDQFTAVAKKVPAWADREIAELAPTLTVRQLQRLLGKYVFADVAEPDPPADDSAATAGDPVDVESAPGSGDQYDEPLGPTTPEGHRPPTGSPVVEVGGCRMWFDDDGCFHLRVDTDLVTGKLIEQAVLEARDHLFLDGRTDASLLDAVLEIAQRSMDAVDGPDRRNRWRLNLHLRTDGRCTDDAGMFLPDAIRRHITCDGLVCPTFYANGKPVSVGRSQHIVPDRTRRLVIERDGGCGVPGCAVTHHLEVHHIIHWEHDGPTDSWNLVALCPHHHRLHHQGRLGITGNADQPGGLTFTDADGRVINASGAKPKPPGGPPPPITGRYVTPLGERLDMRWVTFSPPRHDRPDHRQPDYRLPDHRRHHPATTAHP